MPSPPQIAEQTNNGATVGNDGGFLGPEQKPDAHQGVAPGGLYPSEAELPVVSVDAPPATYGGYRPSDTQAPLPAPGSGLPPYSGK